MSDSDNTGNNGNDGNDEQGILPFDDGSAGQLIRKEWHDGRWFFSVVDAVAALTDSQEPRQYWYDMKRRIQDEGFRELSAKCLQLKMRSPLDGKLRHLAEEGVTGQGIANQTHYNMGKAVRAFIVEQGNTLPEELPTPARSIQQLEREEQQRAQVRLQPPLFPSTSSASDDDA